MLTERGAQAAARAAELPQGTLDAAEHRGLSIERWPWSDCRTRAVRRGARLRGRKTPRDVARARRCAIYHGLAHARASPCCPCRCAHRTARVIQPRMPIVG